MKLYYKKTKKFDKQKENPFQEDSKKWHAWIDITTTHNDNDKEIDIDKMVNYHDMDHEYYIDTLDELTELGYLDRIYCK